MADPWSWRLFGEEVDDAWIPEQWVLHGVFRLGWAPRTPEQDRFAWRSDWALFMERGLMYGATVDRVLFAGSEVVEFVRAEQECSEDGDEGMSFSYPTRASRDSRVVVVPSERLDRRVAYLAEVDPSWVDRQLKALSADG